MVIPAKKTFCRHSKNFGENLGKNLGERCYSGFSRTKFLGVRGVIVNHVSGVIVNHGSGVITNPPCMILEKTYFRTTETIEEEPEDNPPS